MAVEPDDQSARRAGFDRRTMLKTAAALGAGAVVWSAPHIENLGFAPAGAAGTPCIILSPESDDKNSNDDDNAYCASPTPCCGQSFGNQGQIERFTFINPAPNCSTIVVRTIPLDCNASSTAPFRNPDVSQFAVVVESTSGSGCGACTLLDAVLLDSRQRTVLESLNNGPSTCLGDGVNASILCDNANLAADARLAVRISCVTGVEGCVTPTP